MVTGKGKIHIFNGFSNKQKQTLDKTSMRSSVPRLMSSCLVSSQSTVYTKPLRNILFNKTSESDFATLLWKGNFLYASPNCDPIFLLAFDLPFISLFMLYSFNFSSSHSSIIRSCGYYQSHSDFLK